MNTEPQKTAERVIEYAKRIAIYQKHSNLVNGLQSFDVLNDKAQEKFLQIRQTFMETQQEGTTKTAWHVLRKAASLYYYSIQMEERSQRPCWEVTFASIKVYLPSIWKEREVEAAADVLYGWRSSSAKNKDEALELEIIQERVESLPRRPGAVPGNQYSKKRTTGRPVSIYLTGEDVEKLRANLVSRGAPVNDQEENRLARAILRLGIQEEYEKIPNPEIE